MLFHEYLLDGYEEDQVILKHKNTEYSASEIRKFSQSYSESFRRSGIKTGDRVVLLMENGVRAIALQLACSIIGAVFIPVSPFEPLSRIKGIIEQYRPSVVLVENEEIKNKFQGEFQTYHPEAFLYSSSERYFPNAGNHKPVESDLIYIISTSGTTGNPKGIKMSHKAVVCFFKASVEYCKLGKNDNVGSISPLQFDLSLLDLGVAWGSKACLSVFSQGLAYTPKKLIDSLIFNKVTQFHSVPAIWNMIIRLCPNEIYKLKHLKSILYAGDKFAKKNMVFLRNIIPALRIINCFGQSESIACTFFDVGEVIAGEATEISVGKGYGGNIFYLVDQYGNLITDDNTPGELWLSNGSLFDGYWENEELTSAKLIPDSFDLNNMNKVYKSGDLLSRNADGNYFFHGRMDNQVKVNGNRVELDEIEQAVLEVAEIADAAAIAVKNGETSSVVLYVSVARGKYIEEDTLRKHCRENLPLYMIPSQIFILNDTFPLSPNGKTDKSKILKMWPVSTL